MASSSSSSSSLLLGPPELQLPPKKITEKSPLSFTKVLAADFNTVKITVKPDPNTNTSTEKEPPTRQRSPEHTENQSPTFESSGNPCVDFFFNVKPDTPPESLISQLDLAWKHHPLTALKLICRLRGVRETRKINPKGFRKQRKIDTRENNTRKTNRESFYKVALWLHKHHPKTFACNLNYMADFGYLKDLPEILYRLLQGVEVPKPDDRVRKCARPPYVWLTNKRGRRYYVSVGDKISTTEPNEKPKTMCGCQRRRRRIKFPPERRKLKVDLAALLSYRDRRKLCEIRKKQNAERINRLRATRLKTREKRMEAENLKVEIAVEEAKKRRMEKKIDMAKQATQRYSRYPNYRFFHDSVSTVFAELLVSDLQALTSGRVGDVSLAAKWCPSLDSSFDRATLICESIARRVFPRDSYPEYKGIEEAHYTYRIRDRLRKEVLVPLRQVLELPETYMSLNEWNSLPYNHVSKVAMIKYKKHFLKHDKERFKEYLEKAPREARVVVQPLLPYEIVKEAMCAGDRREVAELQWKSLVDDLRSSQKLRNCIAICTGRREWHSKAPPGDECIALGMLISELSEDPWKGYLMTFSENPKLQKIHGNGLRSKTEFVREMKLGYSVHFETVLEIVLDVAISEQLRKYQMVKKVFVFSDMEITGEAGSVSYYYVYDWTLDNWATDYEVIQRKYEEKGYEVPHIVIWNIKKSQVTPFTSDLQGMVTVWGFSKNMMKLFLEEDDEFFTPGREHVMNSEIRGPKFDELVVLD